MKILKLIVIFTILIATCLSNEEPTRTAEQMVRNSLLVIEGVVSKIEELSIEEVKGKGEPLKIRKCRAIMKIVKTYKGQLTPDEIKSGNINIWFKQTDDRRYKGDRIPTLKEGEKYFIFIEAFDTSDNKQRLALLHTKNNIREATEIANDATANKALSPTEGAVVPK